MEAGNAREAIGGVKEIARRVRESGSRGLPPGLDRAFRELLRRRGYFVSSAADYAQSLSEIHAVGEGFDLFDLARELAALDRLLPEARFPELLPFAPNGGGNGHGSP